MLTKLTTRKIANKSSTAARYLIEVEGVPVGLLEKLPNTRTDSHPWKLFVYDVPVGEWVPGTDARFVDVSFSTRASTAFAELLDLARDELNLWS